MNLKLGEPMGSRLVSSFGIGVLALSLSGVAIAQPEKAAGPGAKPATAANPTKKSAGPGGPAAPGRLRAKPEKDDRHADQSSGHGKKGDDAEDGAEKSAEKSALPKKPSRKDREAAAVASVKRTAATNRYLAAKQAAEAADAEYNSDDEEVDKVAARAARKAAYDEVKRARKGLQVAQRHLAKEYMSLPKKERDAHKTNLLTYSKELRKDQKDRATASREALSKRYGKKLALKTMKEELAVHAWRVARLNQLIKIAELRERPDDVKRAQELLKKEDQEHKKRLAKLSLAPLPKVEPAATPTPPSNKPVPAPMKPTPATKGAAQ